MSRAQQIFDEKFAFGTPRSAEYQAGCLYILRRKLEDIAPKTCPYPIPGAQADAWFSGCEHGHLLVGFERDRLKALELAGADHDD